MLKYIALAYIISLSNLFPAVESLHFIHFLCLNQPEYINTEYQIFDPLSWQNLVQSGFLELVKLNKIWLKAFSLCFSSRLNFPPKVLET